MPYHKYLALLSPKTTFDTTVHILHRFFAIALIAIGLLLASNPELVSDNPIPTDTFEAIERRIWWGLLIGFGLLFLMHRQIHPWRLTLSAAGSAILFGLLVARFIGILLDGSVAKQWLYVGIECVILALFVWWYFKERKRTKLVQSSGTGT